MAEDARIGYMPTRVWGCPTTAMWTHRLGPTRATVVQVDQGFAAQLDDFVAAMAFHVHDEGDATGVVFEARVVQALPHWCV